LKVLLFLEYEKIKRKGEVLLFLATKAGGFYKPKMNMWGIYDTRPLLFCRDYNQQDLE
jgi:hypothetical protein